jgi:hypothetical protein
MPEGKRCAQPAAEGSSFLELRGAAMRPESLGNVRRMAIRCHLSALATIDRLIELLRTVSFAWFGPLWITFLARWLS